MSLLVKRQNSVPLFIVVFACTPACTTSSASFPILAAKHGEHVSQNEHLALVLNQRQLRGKVQQRTLGNSMFDAVYFASPPKTKHQPHFSDPRLVRSPWVALRGHGDIALLVVTATATAILCAVAPAEKINDGARSKWWALPFFMSTFVICSTGLTIFNKWLFNPDGGNFPHVITLTWWHMFVATVFTQVLRLLRPGLFPDVATQKNNHQLLKMVIPVALLNGLRLWLGNSAYLYLSVSYIQMIKAAMPAMVFLLSALMGLERFTFKGTILLCLLVLAAGGCTHGELLFSWIGFGYNLLSFLCEAGRLMFLKSLLTRNGIAGLDPLSTLFYISPACMLVLTPPMMHELSAIPSGSFYALRFVLAANGLIAFALNLAAVCLMSAVSVTSFALVGLFKDVAIISGSTIMFGNTVTREQVLSAIALFGIARIFQNERQSEQKTSFPRQGQDEQLESCAEVAKDIKYGLSSIETAHANKIVEGMTLICKEETDVFESPESWDAIRTVPAGSRLVASGPPVTHEDFAMVPVRPAGAVEASLLQLEVDIIVEGTTLVCTDEADIFECTDSWDAIDTVYSGARLVAAGPAVTHAGFTMIPIKPVGAVDACLVQIENPSFSVCCSDQ